MAAEYDVKDVQEIMTILSNISFKFSREDVYRRLSFNFPTTKSTENVDYLIDEMIKEGYALSQPCGIYMDFTIAENSGQELMLEGTDHSVKSKDVAKILKDAGKLSVFVCTIGEDLPKKVNEFLEKKEIAKAAVLDAVGSEAVEGVANSINEIIDQNAEAQGYSTIKRFSPGFGDWDLTQQESMLELLNAKEIGVKLSKSYIMMPEKSVSALVGWVKTEKPVRKIYGKKKSEKDT